MNYNALLDGFFGNYWLCYGLLLVYMVLVFVFHKRLRVKEKKLRKAILSFAVPLLWLITLGLINPVYWGYGSPKGITALYVAENKLFVQDYLTTAGGKMSRGVPYSRIHVIDPVSGEQQLRFGVGESKGEIIGVHGDTLAYATAEEVQFFSVSSGQLLYAWNSETLPQLFPALESGLNQFSAYKTGNDLHVTSMDGNRWVLDIMHNSIAADGDNAAPGMPTGKLVLNDGAICVDNDPGYPEKLVYLDYKSGSGDQQVLYGRSGFVLNSKLTFLDGEIVAFSAVDSCFVVMHYTTIARTHVIFTAISWDGQRQLWSLAQTVLWPEDADDDEQVAVLTVPDDQNGLLVLSFATEVIAVDMKDGSVKWRKIP